MAISVEKSDVGGRTWETSQEDSNQIFCWWWQISTHLIYDNIFMTSQFLWSGIQAHLRWVLCVRISDHKSDRLLVSSEARVEKDLLSHSLGAGSIHFLPSCLPVTICPLGYWLRLFSMPWCVGLSEGILLHQNKQAENPYRELASLTEAPVLQDAAPAMMFIFSTAFYWIEVKSLVLPCSMQVHNTNASVLFGKNNWDIPETASLRKYLSQDTYQQCNLFKSYLAVQMAAATAWGRVWLSWDQWWSMSKSIEMQERFQRQWLGGNSA